MSFDVEYKIYSTSKATFQQANNKFILIIREYLIMNRYEYAHIQTTTQEQKNMPQAQI